MRFRTREPTFLLKEPDAGSAPPLDIPPKDALVRTWSLAGDAESPAEELSNGFVFVKVDTTGLTGWIEEGRLEVDTPEPVSEAGFVVQSVRIEAVLNDLPKIDPWFVSADFVIARALLETGVQNLQTPIPGSDGIGPLRVTSGEWRAFLAEIGEKQGYREAYRDYWFYQPWAALFRMHTDAQALSERVERDRKDAKRRMPQLFRATSVDLSLLRLLGTPAGTTVIASKDAAGGSIALNEVIEGNDVFRDEAIRSNPAIFGGGNLPLDTICANIERQMDDALVKAAALILRYAPESVIAATDDADDDDGPAPRDVALPDPGDLDWSGARASRLTQKQTIIALYVAFRRAGFSDAGSRALVAEVGRENSLRPALLFGSHVDPANGAVNVGLFSWQKDRGLRLRQRLADKDLIVSGKMKRGQAALDLQAVFVHEELSASFPATLTYLTDPELKMDYEKAARLLGRDYLRWRFDDPVYASGHRNRRDFLELTHQALEGKIPQSSAVGGVRQFKTEKAPNGFYDCAGLIYNVAGKTRRRPISERCVLRIMTAAAETDTALRVLVTSAGQDPIGFGKRRIGSTRHDVKRLTLEGETADLVLIRDAKIVTPPEDIGLYQTFLEHAASSGFTGIGHYSWGVHVGDGTRAAWGPTRTAASLNARLGKAIRSGWARAGI